MDDTRDGLSHDDSHSTKIEEGDQQHATVTAARRGVLKEGAVTTKTRNSDNDEHSVAAALLQHQDDSLNDDIEDTESDSLASASKCKGSYISTDSEDAQDFDLLRTLRHYHRGRRHRHQSSSSSGCSCDSCVSHSDDSFFESTDGPPRGENTVPRRIHMWLENVKVNWGFLVLGLLLLNVVLTVIASIVAETSSSSQVGLHMLYWTVPLVAVTAGVVITWRAARYLLLRRGYGKSDHIMERWNLIRDAQAKELVYSVRGAIYAPTHHNCKPGRRRHPPVYEVVGYESEFDSETYFDSDLESDGQYRRSLTPWREVGDLLMKERHNIYTKRAWFRDVPVVWWELLPHTQGNL